MTLTLRGGKQKKLSTDRWEGVKGGWHTFLSLAAQGICPGGQAYAHRVFVRIGLQMFERLVHRDPEFASSEESKLLVESRNGVNIPI